MQYACFAGPNLNFATNSCAICSLDYKSKDKCLALKCGHLFHKTCLSSWYSSSSHVGEKTCPYCRAKVIILSPKDSSCHQSFNKMYYTAVRIVVYFTICSSLIRIFNELLVKSFDFDLFDTPQIENTIHYGTVMFAVLKELMPAFKERWEKNKHLATEINFKKSLLKR